jgi:HrpA-like RNA helicase
VTIIHGETGCGKSSTVPVMLMKSHDAQWDKLKKRKLHAAAAVSTNGNKDGATLEGDDGMLPITGYAKMFVTQPRRIAARSLCERVRQSLVALAAAKKSQNDDDDEEIIEASVESIVGLRLGHGERTNDSASTRIWFATTGYVVLLLAHHPEKFNDHSHLVLDEVQL